MASTYAKLIYRDAGRKRTTYLRDPKWSTSPVMGRTLSGRIVNKEGEPAFNGDIHILMATPEDVVAIEDMEMDGFYAELVPLGTAKIPVGGVA
jgi:hypothetical protein